MPAATMERFRWSMVVWCERKSGKAGKWADWKVAGTAGRTLPSFSLSHFPTCEKTLSWLFEADDGRVTVEGERSGPRDVHVHQLAAVTLRAVEDDDLIAARA